MTLLRMEPNLSPGLILRELRTTLGLSQRQLASRRNVPQSTVARIEAGEAFRWDSFMSTTRALGAQVTISLRHPDLIDPITGSYGNTVPNLLAELTTFRLKQQIAQSLSSGDSALARALMLPLGFVLTDTDRAVSTKLELDDPYDLPAQEAPWTPTVRELHAAIRDVLAYRMTEFDRSEIDTRTSNYADGAERFASTYAADKEARAASFFGARSHDEDLERFAAEVVRLLDAGWPRLDDAVEVINAAGKSDSRMLELLDAAGMALSEPLS